LNPHLGLVVHQDEGPTGRTRVSFKPRKPSVCVNLDVAQFVKNAPRMFTVSDAVRCLEQAIRTNRRERGMGRALAISEACHWAELKLMIRLSSRDDATEFYHVIQRKRGILTTIAVKPATHVRPTTAPSKPASQPVQTPRETALRFMSATEARRKLNELSVLRNCGHTVSSALIKHVTNELRRLERQTSEQRTHLHH